MNNSIYNEEDETDESLRPKSTKRIKLEQNVDSGSSTTTIASNEISTSVSNQAPVQHQSQTTATTSQKSYSKQDLIDYFEREFNKRREFYVDKLLELFFLEENGNLPEYYTWRKKTPTNALLQYFKQIAKNNEVEFENLQYDKAKLDQVSAVKIIQLSQVKPSTETQSSLQQQLQIGSSLTQQQTINLAGSSLSQQHQQSPFTTSTSNLTSLSSTSTNNNNANTSLTHLNTTPQFTTPSAVSSSKLSVNNQQLSSKNVISSSFSTPSSYQTSSLQSTSKFAQLNTSSISQFSKLSPSTPIGLSTKKSSRFNALSISSPLTPTTPTSANISSVYESSIGSKEQIVERAKQEAHVIQRVSELRKEGLWSAKRLPRLQEPPREKAHWDYLLEEMTWLATDFAQERKWKKASAKKCARMIMKFHGDKESQAEKAEKENLNNLKKIASKISKEVRQFWTSVEKLVDYKMQTKLEEKRKKALDLHLNFIVDQTEKYSSWIAEGLNKNPSSEPAEDEENSNDNEIEEETALANKTSSLEKIDQEFNLSDQDESDFEDTIAEQERNENKQQNAQELNDLQNEADMPIEDLLKWYAEMESKNEGVVDESMEEEDEEVEVDDTEDQDEEDEQTNESDDQTNEEEGEKEEIGVEYLINLDSETKTTADKKSGPSIEITDIAAGAQSIQPKGNTLSTAQVQTKVPFLLKGELREYQLIGLDWLVQMYMKNLNGVLADEMGLGKTIQTIALLAHLACEKGIWGPHLVVVPTSVMLNWEIEFKKWCPAFKVLTYYGSPKERKLKRQGWTKPNQFHICITSYKLVVQDHNSFRRKKWCYLILDEAQHIKNFKSQRWQMLLNFNTSRRLLLTGTPLQNNLMELWSLMHFLMPNVFSSHRDFKDWFVNPVTGMIEGNQEFNKELISRLHKVLRPFLLRRIKADVEKQLPKKYEHVLHCRLSKRQRFLYEEFMSLTKTKETLESGNFLSVINVLMQLRKVCNHPNLFETRSVQSPFSMRSVSYSTASLCTTLIDYSPFKNVDLNSLSGNLVDLCSSYSASDIHRIKSLQVPSKLIEEIDTFQFDSPPKVPVVKFNNQKQIVTNYRASVPHSLRIRNNLQQNTINSLIETDELKKSLPNFNPKTHICKSTANHLGDHEGMLRNACGKHLTTVELRKSEERKEKLKLIARINNVKCNRHSLYTKDLLNIVDLKSDPKRFTTKLATNYNIGQGFFNCLHNQNRLRKSVDYDQYNDVLSSILQTPEELLNQLTTEIEKFTFVVPSVSAPKIKMHIPHQSPSKRNFESYFESALHKELLQRSECLHKIISNMANQFPELRLIQYDCGKLQTLDKLLWQLRAGGHRVLIFTQMSRMLDIFEQFLNYHGHTYLRLDGSTKIDQRQALMERFNADKRIFCFILSTRSGGVGVNLTGADTVIFYDSDWNPTLDLQAQDRCHRIGQTRDVHIYRLVSEKTVEENILKKARQKQFLNDIAIEGGNFTTAFFKNDTIKELFNMNASSLIESGQNVLSLLQPSKVLIEEVIEDEKMTKLNTQIGQALHAVEEESDVVAAKTAIAEASAEFAEFDESIPLDVDKNEEKSPEEEELERIVSELLPVERYAMQFLETIQEPIQAEQLKQAEEEIEAQKKEWELGHLKSLKEEENERVLKQQEQDEILTMRKEDVAQVYYSKINEDVMPTWAPPTPPQDDYYYDYSMAFLYDTEIMTESQLPSVYVQKESKRIRLENITSRKQTKIRKDENVNIPRSLFDKPSPFILKLRKEVKVQKIRGFIVGGPDVNQLQRIVSNFGSNVSLPQPTTLQQQAAQSKTPNFILHGTQQESQIHWGINEDWSLVEIIQQIQELPINLLVLSPGHIPNWDFVSAHVNSKTSTYRSPKLCRHHYETVILPKEEGRTNEQPSAKKLKKLQKQAALQANQQNQPNNSTDLSTAAAKPQIRPVKISNLFTQDNNSSFTQLMNSRFNNILQIAKKRQPTLKPRFLNQHDKNPKHLMLLQESSINYEQPLLPTIVAQNRADRINRETQNKAKLDQQAMARQRLMQLQQQKIIQCQTPHKNMVTVQSTNAMPNTNIVQHQQPTITQVVPANTAINVTQQAIVQQQSQATNQPQYQQTQFQAAKINPVIAQNSITVSKGNIQQCQLGTQQFVTTPTNIRNMSLSENQQISNLAKALSQAATAIPSQQTSINQSFQQSSNVQTQIIPSPIVSNVIQAQAPRLSTANIQINQALPKIVTQGTTQQTGNLSGNINAPTGTVLSVTSIPQQKIITATFTNSTTRPVGQLATYKTQFLLRPQQNPANKQIVTTSQQMSAAVVQQTSTGAIQAQLTSQPNTGQITLPVSSQQTNATQFIATQNAGRLQIATNAGIITQPGTIQQTGGNTVAQHIAVNAQSQQTASISAPNIIRQSTPVGPTIIATSNALPISSGGGQGTKMADFQIVQARGPRTVQTTMQQQPQQIHIASLAPRSVSTTATPSSLPSMTMPVATNQNIITATGSLQLRRTSTDDEQLFANRNIVQKTQPKIVTSIGQSSGVQQAATISTTTSSQQQTTGQQQPQQSLSAHTPVQLRLLTIPSSTSSVQNQQQSREGTSGSGSQPPTTYLIYNSKGAPK